MSKMTRRNMLTSSAAALAGGAILSRAQFLCGGEMAEGGKTSTPGGTGGPAASAPGAEAGYRPVIVPNGAKLPWKLVDGVKVFHLVAEEVDHEFVPGLRAKCWGYNGHVHGPTIEAVDGDHVRIYVTNRLPAATTVHWHSVLLPNGMDGVGGLTQHAIQPGETYKYEFTLRQVGTAMYHSHHDEMTQIALGMTGLFIIHPRPGKDYGERQEQPVDRDFAIMLHEWRIDAGTSRPNPLEMIEFNTLTMNAKSFPATEPLVVKTGERVRIRLGNLSPMEHHPIHLHGYQFVVTQTDGGVVPVTARHPQATVLVPVGSTRTIEFVADAPGDWAFHCHMTHHVMNQMGHASPNMIGVKMGDADRKVQSLLPGYMTMGEAGMADMGEMGMPVPPNSIPMEGGRGKYDYITMGGMFTVLKVREDLTSYEDPGWYEAPAGTLAVGAKASDLERDGIDVRVDSGAKATGHPEEGTSKAPVPQPGVLYTCRMHPEVVLDKPGRCPKCGMTLVVKK